jgi:hypothetical protein
VLLALLALLGRRRPPAARRRAGAVVIEGPLLVIETRPRRWRRR